MKKKLLAALLAVCMVASMMLVPAMAADEGAFSDVSGDHWASEAIERWAGYGVLNGHDDGTFNPDGPMTRAQFAKFIVTLMGLPTDSTEMPFEDVMGSADEWAAPYIAAAHKAGIINGKSTTRFAPRDDVSFDQSAAMMARAVGLVEPSAYGDKVTEKLTELGMLDDNVKPDADPTRALVAGLADNMIEIYANDAEADAEKVTGDVTRVILAVNGGKVEVENATVKAPIVVTSEASVEVKSSTVEAPIVVDSASVALTETKAGNVVVSGTEASVTADKDSTVAEVAVSGTAPSVELNGTVEKVTVAEGTTEVEVKGEGVSSENVTNNTGADITVNDETVEPTPAEPENPDDEQGESTGFVPAPSTPVTNPEQEEAPTKAPQKETSSTDAGDVTPGATACTNHVWKTTKEAVGDGGSKAATCTEDGYDLYKCTGTVAADGDTREGGTACTATKKVTVPKLGHNWYRKTVTGATCTVTGTILWSCGNGGDECEKIPAVEADVEAGIEAKAKNTEIIPALGHQQANFSGQAATCTNWGLGTGIMCGRSGCEWNHVIAAAGGTPAPESRASDTITLGTTAPTIDASKWFKAPTALKPLDHSYVAKTTGTGEEAVTKYVCSRCGDERESCPINHANILKTATCSVCKEKGTHDPEGESHTAGATFSKDTTKHWKVCTVPGCGAKVGEANHSYGPGTPVVSGTTYCECGATKACTKDHSEILTSATCSDCGGAGTKQPATPTEPPETTDPAGS